MSLSQLHSAAPSPVPPSVASDSLGQTNRNTASRRRRQLRRLPAQPVQALPGALAEAQPASESAASEGKPKAKAVWSPYNSIENADNARSLARIRAFAVAEAGDCEWVATEKVHGANFCFETDGDCVEYASRTVKLGAGADFFNAHSTMPAYHPFVLQAFRLARQRRPQLERLLIYGEYFGGWYPGLEQVPGLRKVQGGVAYSPGHHFYAFDVSLDGAGYLDFDDARELLLAAGFPLVAAPLRRGTMDELLAMDVESLETSLPAQLGHVPLDKHRIAEGIVIRPAREVACTGAHRTERAIMKIKARAFWEATNQHCVLARKAAAKAEGDGTALGASIEVQGLVNENRLRGVISKSPDLLQEGQLDRVAGLLAADALEDLKKYHGEELSRPGKRAAAVRRAVLCASEKFVSERIAAIREDVG